MNLLAPKYYNDFVCIADKCRHSCCIGWEIDVDESALKKYSLLDGKYSENIRNSIEVTDTPHFKLSENEHCPHLNEKGLCNIILNCGENCLCDICREHPRFYNYTNTGKEVGIGMSCEAACKLILDSNNFDEFVIISEDEAPAEAVEFDAIGERKRIFDILKHSDFCESFEEKMSFLYEIYDIYLDADDVRKTLSQLEYLNSEHKELFNKFTTDNTHDKSLDAKLLRAFAYFIFRHCSEAESYEEFFVSLSFATVCVRLIASLSTEENIYEIARIVSEEIEYSEQNIEMIKNSFYLDEKAFNELFN